jgi:hypothetical protein
MTSLMQKLETVRVDAISPHPLNPHEGDVDGIAESLAENQQFLPIVVQRSTGYVLSGNHTLLAARQLGNETIDVVYVDVEDDRALKIMLAANKTKERDKGYRDPILAEIFAELDGDLTGTGWVEQEVDDLLANLGDEIEMPYQPSEADYAETEDEFSARSDRLAAPSANGGAGTIRETIIVLDADQHDELHLLFSRARGMDSMALMTNGELVLRAMRLLMDDPE